MKQFDSSDETNTTEGIIPDLDQTLLNKNLLTNFTYINGDLHFFFKFHNTVVILYKFLKNYNFA